MTEVLRRGPILKMNAAIWLQNPEIPLGGLGQEQYTQYECPTRPVWSASASAHNERRICNLAPQVGGA